MRLKAWFLLLLPMIAAAVSPLAPALAQTAPAYTDAGRVLQSEQQNWLWRQRAPWAQDPFWSHKNPPSQEPLIEFHNMDVEGHVVTPQPAGARGTSP
ncbi:MAG: hypothetical protein IPK79_03290 [Vampirovibrionales bacterium]|nr:hypothetical protein [Vampirovibrionales bacterium]